MSRAKSVLVVDDDEDLRATIAQLIVDAGWSAEACPDGRTGLERLQDAARPAPDLVLLDVMMPGMSGWQFLERKRDDARIASIPVVLMTASRLSSKTESDVLGYLRKPFSVDQLLVVIKDAIGRERSP